MSKINPKAVATPDETKHLNYMGGPSYFLKDAVRTLEMTAASSFFGEPQYYNRDQKEETKVSRADRRYLGFDQVTYLQETLNGLDPQEWRGLSPQTLMEKAIDAALDADPTATLALAIKLRKEWHIRLTPQVILVRAAHNPKVRGTQLIRRFAPKILQRVDDAISGLAYQFVAYGKRPIPNSLKRAWADFIKTRDEYKLAKYKMEDHEVNLFDLINLITGKKYGALHSDAVVALMKGTLHLGEEHETWESKVSREGSNKKTWEESVAVMGHMALLRNLRNLIEKGVDMHPVATRLVETAEDGQQLPFRYLSAYNAVTHIAPDYLEEAVQESMFKALKFLPHFTGKVASLADNSGSAWGTTTSTMGTMHIAEIANLTAMLTAMNSDDGYVGLFGDKLEMIKPVQEKNILRQLEKINAKGQKVGQSTENGIWLFWDKAIRNKEHWDTVFIYSDMQAGHGGLYGLSNNDYKEFGWSEGKGGSYGGRYIDVPKLIATYRKLVNPKVTVFMVQVAGYQDTILPERYERAYILGGWSEALLQYADTMLKLQEEPVPQQTPA